METINLGWITTWCVHVSQHMDYLLFFPGFLIVLGCADGTQIRISTPTANEADFVYRKKIP